MRYACVTCGEAFDGTNTGHECTHMRAMSPWPCVNGGHVGLGLEQWMPSSSPRKVTPECPGVSITEPKPPEKAHCHCSCHVTVSEEEVTEAISGLLELAAATKPKGTNGLRSPDVGGASQHQA